MTLEIIFQIISIRSFRKYVINKGLLLNARPSLLTVRNQNEPMNHAKTDEKRHHKMVIFLTLISIFHKTFFLAYTFYTMFFGLSILCLFINSYSVILKHSSKFFVFHFFNKKFRNELVKGLQLFKEKNAIVMRKPTEASLSY
jgi:hypothetical protein